MWLGHFSTSSALLPASSHISLYLLHSGEVVSYTFFPLCFPRRLFSLFSCSSFFKKNLLLFNYSCLPFLPIHPPPPPLDFVHVSFIIFQGSAQVRATLWSCSILCNSPFDSFQEIFKNLFVFPYAKWANMSFTLYLK